MNKYPRGIRGLGELREPGKDKNKDENSNKTNDNQIHEKQEKKDMEVSEWWGKNLQGKKFFLYL